jgi:hypothetical protein
METTRMERLWRRAMWRREAYGERERVLTARAVFWLSCQLARIKTKQRMFRIVWDTELDDPDPKFHSVPSEPRWLPSRTSMSLMSVAMHLAWDHWSHFALEHSDYEVETRCPDWRCRGWVHPRQPDEEA